MKQGQFFFSSKLINVNNEVAFASLGIPSLDAIHGNPLACASIKLRPNPSNFDGNIAFWSHQCY